jgi:diacylglycerol kinase family enzyme
MRPTALVLVNAAARGGRARARLEACWPAVAERFDPQVVPLDGPGRWRSDVGRALAGGVRHFVAAGGDGTVGALADALWTERGRVPAGELTLAAVGLGSSNDFHKPVRARAAGVPVRLGAPQPRDLGRVRYEGADGAPREHVFVVSGSFGLTAQANAFFNSGDPLLRQLRRRWTVGAIAYAALRTIALGRGVRLRLTLAGPRPTGAELRFASLGVLKTPHLSGGLLFDTPVRGDDGLLAVNAIEDRGRAATLGALIGLARGRFSGRAGTRHWSVPAVDVAADAPVELEIDGEVVLARRARFDVLEERILACA